MNKCANYFLLIFFFIACNENSIVSEKQQYLLSFVENDQNGKKKIFDYYESDKIYFSADTISGEIFGNYYQFYENGLFQLYQFMVDSLNSTYLIEYDSVGNILEMKGNPICRRHINFNYKSDSALISVIISTFPYKKVQTSISSMGREFFEVETKKYSNLSYVENYEYTVPIEKVDKVFEVIKVECWDMHENILKYYDTISFFKEIHM